MSNVGLVLMLVVIIAIGCAGIIRNTDRIERLEAICGTD